MDFVDRIGDRLDHPERVPGAYAHLLPDDHERVKRILSVPVKGVVLDAGCSDGAITARIVARWKVQAVGVDCRRPEAFCEDATWQFVLWDITTPRQLRIDGFDAIYVTELFEHLTDADALRARDHLLANLKPGGDLIVTVPNREVAESYVAACRDRWRWPDHKSVWRPDDLSYFLGRQRFKKLHRLPLYEGERPDQSIWLIVHAQGWTGRKV